MNRSNPLPIHQFPNLIDEVAKLKRAIEEVGEALPLRLDEHGQLRDNELSLIDTIVPSSDHKLRVDLHNAAPALLDVLSMIRAGDAEVMHWMLTADGDDPTQEEINDVLRRYRDMARKMEENR